MKIVKRFLFVIGFILLFISELSGIALSIPYWIITSRNYFEDVGEFFLKITKTNKMTNEELISNTSEIIEDYSDEYPQINEILELTNRFEELIKEQSTLKEKLNGDISFYDTLHKETLGEDVFQVSLSLKRLQSKLFPLALTDEELKQLDSKQDDAINRW